MASEQVDTPKAAEGAPAQDLPSRPAKQAKDKAPKGGKKEGLEVRWNHTSIPEEEPWVYDTWADGKYIAS